MNSDYLLLERPSWRGVLHSWAFFASIPAGVLLIVFASSAAGRAAASIYTATLLLVFGTSASYHRLAQSLRARRIMQRLDHSMIYLLIAGTYAPLCLVALPLAWGIPLLAAVTAIGITGIVIKIAGIRRLQGLGYALYPIMGWAAVVAAPALADSLTGLQLALIVGGGIAYTVGFPVLLLKRPDPWPRSFGYHEVWHGFTVLAAMLHFGAVASVVA
ncbi:MAG: hemolysin III family protein [Ilumatobacteraceae bacterium]|nr:hemolysin III family protein [Ilumatobacteraceae bacterium]